MNTTELLAQFRSEVSDEAAPYLWGDALVYSYINDAQKWFCRLTNGVSDSRTPRVTKIAIQPGVVWYDTDPSILKVRKVTRADTGRDVPVVNAERMADFGIRFDGKVEVLGALVQGLEEHALRAWPVPPANTRIETTCVGGALIGATSIIVASAEGLYAGQSVSGVGIAPFTTVVMITGTTVTLSLPTSAAVAASAAIFFDLTVELSVFRLPLTEITEDGEQALEIDSQHHIHLLLWVKSLAYNKQDADAFDRRKSDDFAQDFRSYCAGVKKEQDRARRVVGTVQYGGL